MVLVVLIGHEQILVRVHRELRDHRFPQECGPACQIFLESICCAARPELLSAGHMLQERRGNQRQPVQCTELARISSLSADSSSCNRTPANSVGQSPG